MDSAHELVPELNNAVLKAQWAGLRPGAPEGVPYIGKLGSYSNFYINAGQFRNGLVLAPASAHLLAGMLLGNEMLFDPSPYDPSR
jgi:glycine oxidase|tara:strand:- start:3980 stop:4234 length:255 start_codon:yes stop_codon:yes gene_type:complete